jgi:hypothetical protein
MDFTATLSGFFTARLFVQPSVYNYWIYDLYVRLAQYLIRHFSLTLLCGHLPTHSHVICSVSSIYYCGLYRPRNSVLLTVCTPSNGNGT